MCSYLTKIYLLEIVLLIYGITLRIKKNNYDRIYSFVNQI